MFNSFKKMSTKVSSEDFKISRKGKWYAIAPIIIILSGLIVFFVVNFNLGLDFTGGRVIRVHGVEDYQATRSELTTIFRRLERDHNARFSIMAIEGERGDSIDVTFQNISGWNDAQMDALAEDLIAQIQSATGLEATNDGTITARQSQQHVLTTFIAVAVALGAMLVYMLFRFKYTSGISALVGLMHDVFVMLALTVIFRVQVNAAYIAALITVIGYSLNNTLILFDRIRTLEKTHGATLTTEEIVDRGVRETFKRTMATTITTVVPIFVLIVAGVPLIRQFALPIFFGLVAGTFSTIFVTTALYVRFENARKAIKKRKALAAK